MSQGWWVLKRWSEKTLIEKASSVVTAVALAIIIFILILPTPKGRNEGAEGAVSTEENSLSPEVSEPPLPRHNWTYRDGNQYGYEQGISDEQRAQGQVATKLLMFRFNGERNGKYQAYVRDGDYASVLECQSPCEYVKSMVFSGRGKSIKTEHMRAVPGSIASALIADMRDGDLDLHTFEREGKRYSLWFDEQSGVTRVPVTPEANPEQKG